MPLPPIWCACRSSTVGSLLPLCASGLLASNHHALPALPGSRGNVSPAPGPAAPSQRPRLLQLPLRDALGSWKEEGKSLPLCVIHEEPRGSQPWASPAPRQDALRMRFRPQFPPASPRVWTSGKDQTVNRGPWLRTWPGDSGREYVWAEAPSPRARFAQKTQMLKESHSELHDRDLTDSCGTFWLGCQAAALVPSPWSEPRMAFTVVFFFFFK